MIKFVKGMVICIFMKETSTGRSGEIKLLGHERKQILTGFSLES